MSTATQVRLVDTLVGSARGQFELHMPGAMADFIPPADWAIYRSAMREARARGMEIALGGGFAVSFYTGFWRNTKDLDIYVTADNRDRVPAAAAAAALSDYYPEKPYDRSWIYRATRDGVIVDYIWAMANGVADVDEAWVTLGPQIDLYDERVALVPPEELLWSKIYIVQRERCDWPDVLNLLYAVGPQLNWPRLLARIAGDERLLAAVLQLFAWVAPGRAQQLPEVAWSGLGLPLPPRAQAMRDEEHIRQVDSRPWFAPDTLVRHCTPVESQL